MAVFDQTSFSKFLLAGPDAEAVLQWLCTADVAVPPGRTVYTGMLNSRGTYEADITVTRLSAEEFLLVSSASQTEHDKDHIRRRIPAGGAATLLDVTSAYAVYGVMGPRSRELLSAISRSDFTDKAFPFGSSRTVDIGYATVRATRITYVGELGWELFVPPNSRLASTRTSRPRVPGWGWGMPVTMPSSRCGWKRRYRAYGQRAQPGLQPGTSHGCFSPAS